MLQNSTGICFFRGMIQTQKGGHHGNEKKNNPQNGFINRRGTGR